MIRLNDIQLVIREDPERSPGYAQDFTRVLVIAQLEDEKLYTAAEVAKTAWCPVTPDTYQRQREALASWAKQDGKNIAQTPDNVYPGTTTKVRRRAARWKGSTWKDHLCDVLWNRAVEVFEERRRLRDRDRADHREETVYWWSERYACIVSEVPETGAPAIGPEKPPLDAWLAHEPYIPNPPRGFLRRVAGLHPILAVAAMLFILLGAALTLRQARLTETGPSPDISDTIAGFRTEELARLLREKRAKRSDITLFTPDPLDRVFVLKAYEKRARFTQKEPAKRGRLSVPTTPKYVSVNLHYADMVLQMP